MKRSSFVAFCLVLVTVFLQVYSYIRYRLSGVEVLQVQVERLEEEKKQEELKSQVAEYQFQSYRQQVATLLPETLKKNLPRNQEYQLRNLASLSSSSGYGVEFERASSLFEKARREFLEGYFERASLRFSFLIKKHPESRHYIEAHFLLIESLFQTKDFERCLEVIDEMVSLFPDNELTGFSMLRLAQIYQLRDRPEDAAEVYKAILLTFMNPDLQRQARLSLTRVEL